MATWSAAPAGSPPASCSWSCSRSASRPAPPSWDISPDDLLHSTGAARRGALGALGGRGGVRAGRLLCTSRRRRTRCRGCFLVLLLAFAAQRLAAGLFGGEISGFFGMLVATPLAYLIQLRFKGPPAMVTFLPSFWLVVPGALGLLSVDPHAERSGGRARRPRHRGVRRRVDRDGNVGGRLALQGAERALRLVAAADPARPRRTSAAGRALDGLPTCSF